MEQEISSRLSRRGRFVNAHLENPRRTIWDAILWKLGRYKDLTPLPLKPSEFCYPAVAKPFNRTNDWAVWIGHSSYLVDFEGCKFLTDPVWGKYCSPIPIQALKRLAAPPFPLTALPKLSSVLISHNHYDHLDEKTVCRIAMEQPNISWIVPQRLKPWFEKRKIGPCYELSWWSSVQLGPHRITAVPTQHFSGRTLWDQNKTCWNGYIVESLATSRKFYFVGDTGYNPLDFKAIGARFAPVDLSLIPIGTYAPRRFMSTVHSSPEDAVEIHLDVRSKLSLGMHWKTFRLSEESLDRPPYDLYLAMQKKNLDFDTFLPIDIGTYINW